MYVTEKRRTRPTAMNLFFSARFETLTETILKNKNLIKNASGSTILRIRL